MSKLSTSSRSPSQHRQVVASAEDQSSPQITKRKRSTDDNFESTPLRPIKLKKAKKAKRVEDDNLDLEHGLNLAIGKLDSRLQADYVAQRTKRFSSELSLVELEDRHVPAKAFRDTSDWDRTRMLKNLPEFLEHYSSRGADHKFLSSSLEQAGSPHTIVVTSAGLRAADIARVLRKFQTKESVVAKLFAKHIKLKDAIEYVRRTRICIGVGTPSRIIDLFNAGALTSSNLERIVIDASHFDQKKRGIFDMRETQEPLVQLLNRMELKSRYSSDTGAIQILLY
ncbi:hypothetical protein JMJ35_007512 [Cladonia borealis]|uniref:Protein CMS1 n=1 Tax=Cladonia borealis TaxID=184061 RepID=A0AA39UZN0_9LECA|nr:hypothetical protein JMJ35_007512 [Cladonia borealis]